MSRLKTFVVAIGFLSIASSVQAQSPNLCLTTQDLFKLNPQVSTRVLFWKAKVKKSLALVSVKIPESEDVLVNIVECVQAEIREHRPGEEAVIDVGEDGSAGRCSPLGDMWVPMANIAEASSEQPIPEFNESDPAEYFSKRIAEHLGTFAKSMRWDPVIARAINGIDKSFLAVFGASLVYTSTKYITPKTFWQKARLKALQGMGVFLVLRQGYLAFTGAESEFVKPGQERSQHLENLIRQIDERMSLRLDGQDQGRNLEEIDGYSALVLSIERANEDTFDKFCNQEASTQEPVEKK